MMSSAHIVLKRTSGREERNSDEEIYPVTGTNSVGEIIWVEQKVILLFGQDREWKGWW